MVNKCCVYGCKSNYEVRNKAFKESKVKVPHVPTFSFPKDETLRYKLNILTFGYKYSCELTV